MPRAARPGRQRRISVSPEVWNWLLTGERPANNYDLFVLAHDDQPNGPLFEVWSAVGDEVVATFADAHPGRRPSTWWKLSSPAPRKRLGGKGTVASELLASLPYFERGIPAHWIDGDWIWTHDGGLAPDAYVALDPKDLPSFESEATFLRRHKLLLKGELRRLRAADFEPETIVCEPESISPVDEVPTGAAGRSNGSSPLTPLQNRTSFEQ